jgi:cytochrome c peroxidase
MMKSKQLTGLILAGVTGLTMMGMMACEGDNVIGGSALKTPNLANASSFNYETVTLLNGTSLSVKDMIMGRTFKFTNGFPSTTGSVDTDMQEAAMTFSNASAQLGRVLFYDKRMSLNNTVSCGSCHHQSLGFSDRMPVSVGFGGKVTRRNSMSINNPVSFNNLFWDSRAQSPMDLSLRPVFDHIEMGMESDEMLEKKLAATDFYGPLFKEAFGTTEITRRKVSLAITHFVTSMVSMHSKNDKVSEGMAQFTAMEKMGHDLFFSERASCFKCHSGSNFSAPDDPGGAYGAPTVAGTANIGLDKSYADNGKGNGKFRIPSLRNIELSAPYMHDGRFTTLEAVVDHYSRGIQAHPHLDANLKDGNGQPKKMNFTTEEKDALVAFLRTLTDVSFISNPKYSDPFAN